MASTRTNNLAKLTSSSRFGTMKEQNANGNRSRNDGFDDSNSLIKDYILQKSINERYREAGMGMEWIYLDLINRPFYSSRRLYFYQRAM